MVVDSDNDRTDTSSSENEAPVEEVSGDVAVSTENQELENSVMLHQNMREKKENIVKRTGKKAKRREQETERRWNGLYE